MAQTNKKKDFIDALRDNIGNISIACKYAGIGRSTYYRWYNEDQEFKEDVDNVQEAVIDRVENHLLNMIFDENDITATIFFLKTKGKKRGYGDKPEPIAPKEEDHKITVEFVGNEDQPQV